MNNIPDTTTVVFFRERLRNVVVIEGLFEKFEEYLRSLELQARGGQIIVRASSRFPNSETVQERMRK